MNDSIPTTGPAAVPVIRKKRGEGYVHAVGPRLRILLFLVFASFALLGASGVYLFAVRVLEAQQGHSFTTVFTLWMFLFHLLVGVAMIVPFLLFGVNHFLTARTRPNRLAVRLGILLFLTSLVVVASGVVLIQLDSLPQLPSGTTRWIIYGLHVVAPVIAIVIYILHRRAGPAIKWKWGLAWGSVVGLAIIAMFALHKHDPRTFHARFSPEGEQYFEPSKSRTANVGHIPAEAMMMDEYCLKCHPKIYETHIHSAHKLSSFNNPAYLFSVMETRRRMGVRASRWCAGCHDPVPFFSGAFDDRKFEPKTHPTANAGITCTVCHSITHVNSRSGNGDYIIDEPIHYPFATSKNPMLQWLNNQLVKARPDFHKKTFLKPFHRDKERFCSVCHHVGLPQEVNRYKEFLPGQNHADSYWMSGVSGQGTGSFYYPKKSKRCADCHMPLIAADDFGARDFDGSGVRKIHSHLFPGGNTGAITLAGIPGWRGIVEQQRRFLRKGNDGHSPTMRIDIFGLKERKTADAKLQESPLIGDKPLRPFLPKLQPGGTYFVEVVIRTLNIGHLFTQGTVDSNEVWVEFIAKSGGKIIGQNGGMDGKDSGRVDEWAHFLNVLVLDRNGNRIDRRNAQDIFTPLYDNQIPPGAGHLVHYLLKVPKDVTGPIELSARVRYRKFDYAYMQLVHAPKAVPALPIVDLCEDKVILPVAGVAENVKPQTSPIKPAWQRWNDYGIGCLLEGKPPGKGIDAHKSVELMQAKLAFEKLLGAEFAKTPVAKAHGYLNLARVHNALGSLAKAVEMLKKAKENDPPAPWWTVARYSGLVNMKNNNFEEAIANFETIVDPDNQPRERNFDFSKDWFVRNMLGKAMYELSQAYLDQPQERRRLLRSALGQFELTIGWDPENAQAHDFLHRCFERLSGGEDVRAAAITDPNECEKTLQKLTDTITDEGKNKSARIEAVKTFLRTLRESPAKCRSSALVQMRARCRTATTNTRQTWVRVALVPVVNELDVVLLGRLPELGKTMANPDKSAARRLEAAERIVQILNQLQEYARQGDVHSLFLGPASLPKIGGPVNLALAGMAEGRYLHGPLPPPRLLKLQALRETIRPLFNEKNENLQQSAARVLSAVHLTMFGIYTPDTSAEGRAKRIYRSRHPAADRASQAIVIHELK